MSRLVPSLMSMLNQLIAAPSVSSVSSEFDSSNRAVIDLLANWLDDLGFVVEIMPLPTQPLKANLLATWGKVDSGSAGLMLAGHTDTVPYDATFWRHDPFHLTEHEGRLYGLGASDMKSFFALAIEAALGFDPEQFKQPLTILATADEESSMDGARLLVERGCPHVRYAVIGEPTGLRPVNAHKGIMMEALRLIGRGGHSSDPSLGRSALEAMQRVIDELLNWRTALQAQYKNPRFRVPVPTLNLGYIRGGDNPNRICETCELHFDLRPLPGMALDELREQITQRVEHALAGSGVDYESFSLFHGTPPMHTAEDSPIIVESVKYCGHHPQAVSFCTEGPYLHQLGIDTVILGPGDIDQAHQPDEYLAVERIAPGVEILGKLIRRFCL